MKLIPQIKERRMEAHMTQRELAKLSGISESRLSLMENGKQYPLPETLWRIAKCIGCKVDDLYHEAE